MSRFNRRTLLRYSLLSAGAALARPAFSATHSSGNRHGNDTFVIDDTSAVAETDSGKVAGYIHNNIRVFKGIPYAEIHAPESRWMRGTKVKPWAGVRSSRAAGPACPPTAAGGGGEAMDEMAFRGSGSQLVRLGEDCLRVNVWTPGLDNRKRQVLFYCHGGGYNGGSSLMGSFYEGTNLAQYGDVVVVSMNHRLNAFGFLDLTAYGSRWADSANVGMLDVVDALKWVHTNIANFGGDPNKVMIFGHSGGGSKVTALLSMPEAKGLFNRAVAQSPGPLPLASPEEGAVRTDAFLKLVNVSPSNLDALHKLSSEQIARAAGSVAATANQGRDRFDYVGKPDIAWRPVVDGHTVAYEPTRPNAPSDVPLMIGTVLHEFVSALGHPEYEQMKEAEARDAMRVMFGPATDEVYDTYKTAFPQANAFEVSAIARAMGRFRGNSVKVAQNRAAVNAAPSYLYWVQWRSRNFGGLAMSHHEIEMPLVFQNSDITPEFTGATDEARALSVKMTDSWLAFARTGNPNTKALPEWKPVTATNPSCMVFDSTCRIDPGSDAKAIEVFWKSRKYS